MVMVPINGVDRYFDDIVKRDLLDAARLQVMKRDSQFILFCTGNTGTGKTRLMSQWAKYLDPNFGLDNIFFTPKEFKNALLNFPEFSVVMLDESRAIFNNKASGRQQVTEILDILSEIRYRHLFIIIIAPVILNISRELLTDHSNAVIRCYAKATRNKEGTPDLERGFFEVYPRSVLADMLREGKQKFKLDGRWARTRGHFSDWGVYSQVDYQKKKADAVEGRRKVVKHNFDWKKANDLRWEGIIDVYMSLRNAELLRLGALKVLSERYDTSDSTIGSRADILQAKIAELGVDYRLFQTSERSESPTTSNLLPVSDKNDDREKNMSIKNDLLVSGSEVPSEAKGSKPPPEIAGSEDHLADQEPKDYIEDDPPLYIEPPNEDTGL